jgi:hypothetical protein
MGTSPKCSDKPLLFLWAFLACPRVSFTFTFIYVTSKFKTIRNYTYFVIRSPLYFRLLDTSALGTQYFATGHKCN